VRRHGAGNRRGVTLILTPAGGRGARPRRRRPRILLYTAVAAIGGAEAALGTLARAVDDRHDGRYEVHVAGVSRPVVEAIVGPAAGVVTHVAADGVRDCARLLRRVRPDLLQVNLEVPWGATHMLAAGLALPGLRVVAVQHMAVRTTRLVPWLRTRAMALRLDAHVAVSADAARRVEDFYALGRGSVLVIHNGVPVRTSPARLTQAPRNSNEVAASGRLFSRNVDEVAAVGGSAGAAPRELVIGCVGRLDRVKGHDVAIRALAKLPGARLVIIGSGSERQALRDLATEVDAADRVSLPGWSDRVPEALAGFDVFCHPSRYEGLGLALIEAMLAGLPCVASRVGGVPEVLGECGLLVPPEDPDALADALARLATDPALRARLGTDAVRRAGTAFNVGRMAGAYQDLWARILASGRSPRLRVPTPKP
jgi:glycosyltransferase involved in cell wall biosynthesis